MKTIWTGIESAVSLDLFHFACGLLPANSGHGPLDPSSSIGSQDVSRTTYHVVCECFVTLTERCLRFPLLPLPHTYDPELSAPPSLNMPDYTAVSEQNFSHGFLSRCDEITTDGTHTSDGLDDRTRNADFQCRNASVLELSCHC